MNALFEEPLIRKLPVGIARACQAMLAEIATHGEQASADETALAIEKTIIYFGRLWVAEYLSSIVSNPHRSSTDLNAALTEQLGRDKILCGHWLTLARQVRAHFVATGSSTVIEGLLNYNPGELGERTPLSKLLAFRNQFAHGSFFADVVEVREHRGLLHEILHSVPGLVDQPVLVRDTESGVWLAATSDWPAVIDPEIEAPAGHPIIIGKDRRVLTVYPLLIPIRSATGWTFETGDSRELSKGLRAHPALAVWLERYEYERQGHLEMTPRSKGPLDEDFAGQLMSVVSSDGLVLVDAPPGTFSERVPAALDGFDVSAFAAVSRLRIVEGDVSQSGLSAARAVLRLVERALGEKDGIRTADIKNALREDGSVARAIADLEHAGKRVLLVLGDLHAGMQPYRGEPITIDQLWRFLAGRPRITVVATAWPGALGRPVFDHRLRLPTPVTIDDVELRSALSKLLVGQPLRRRVLKAIVDADQPLDLFAVCDRLDRDAGSPVFEPAVERALWDLEPVLEWSRTLDENHERVRRWRPYHSSLRSEM